MRLRPFAAAPGVTWESVRRDLDAWAREVRDVLNGGLRLRDQVRVVRDVTIDTAALPVVIETPAGLMPITVALARATVQRGDGTVVSGGAVHWRAVRGGVQLVALDALEADTRYDATIVVVE